MTNVVGVFLGFILFSSVSVFATPAQAASSELTNAARTAFCAHAVRMVYERIDGLEEHRLARHLSGLRAAKMALVSSRDVYDAESAHVAMVSLPDLISNNFFRADESRSRRMATKRLLRHVYAAGNSRWFHRGYEVKAQGETLRGDGLLFLQLINEGTNQLVARQREVAEHLPMARGIMKFVNRTWVGEIPKGNDPAFEAILQTANTVSETKSLIHWAYMGFDFNRETIPPELERQMFELRQMSTFETVYVDLLVLSGFQVNSKNGIFPRPRIHLWVSGDRGP